jgi:hypothetical protein
MIVYVAAPYSNVQDKEHLMNTIAVVCGQYMKDNPGEYTITGLVHHYACQHHSDLGTDWNFWKDFCVEFLRRCDKMLVIKFPGWESSHGVAEEIRVANELNIPVVYYDLGL